jgi:hypothetical protein
MTPSGGASSATTLWNSIDWKATESYVRRLQVRIAKAVREERWGKVKALQRVGGELLICDKNQTVGCLALVRSSFSKIRCKSSAYYKTGVNRTNKVRHRFVPQICPALLSENLLPIFHLPHHSPTLPTTPKRLVGRGRLVWAAFRFESAQADQFL